MAPVSLGLIPNGKPTEKKHTPHLFLFIYFCAIFVATKLQRFKPFFIHANFVCHLIFVDAVS